MVRRTNTLLSDQSLHILSNCESAAPSCSAEVMRWQWNIWRRQDAFITVIFHILLNDIQQEHFIYQDEYPNVQKLLRSPRDIKCGGKIQSYLLITPKQSLKKNSNPKHTDVSSAYIPRIKHRGHDLGVLLQALVWNTHVVSKEYTSQTGSVGFKLSGCDDVTCTRVCLSLWSATETISGKWVWWLTSIHKDQSELVFGAAVPQLRRVRALVLLRELIEHYLHQTFGLVEVDLAVLQEKQTSVATHAAQIS